jgi:tetratricopeptide (TPR) repeat protein
MRFVVAALLTVVPLSAQAEVSDAERRQCTGEGVVIAPEVRIANCTALIEDGKVPAAELFHPVNSRGVAWYEKGDFDRAIADFSAAVELNPKYADGFYNRGIAWSAKGDLARAIADFSAAIRIEPRHARAFNNRGDLLDRTGAFDRAIADYDAAIRIKPDYAVAYLNRGNAWLHKRDIDRALSDYSEAIRLRPDFAAAFVARGHAWVGKGNFDRAIADLDRAIRIDPGLPLAYRNRGNAWRMKGDLDSAIADYDAAIRLRPDDAKALSSRGDAEAEQGRYDHALADKLAAADLVAKTPENAGYFSDVGDMHYALGAYAEAEPWFAIAVGLTPSSSWDQLYLHLARRWQGKDDIARLAAYARTLEADAADAYAEIIRFVLDPEAREDLVVRRLGEIVAAKGDGPLAAYARCNIGFALFEAKRALQIRSEPMRQFALAALGASERCAAYHNARRLIELTERR